MAVRDRIPSWTCFSGASLEQLTSAMDMYLGKQCVLTIPHSSHKKCETQQTSPHWSFLLTLDSNLTLELGGSSFPSVNGTLYGIPPQTPYLRIQHYATSCFYSFLFERTWTEHVVKEVLGLTLPNTWCCVPCHGTGLRFLIRKFMEKSSKESVSADFSSAIELMLLDDLLCPLCSDGTEKRAASYVYPESMAEVIEKIQRDCCSVDLNVANLARRSAMSERTFLRKFRQATGMSPKHYILSYRMARARVAIDQDPGKPLAQIALDCGFYNLSHFSRLFSQFYGYVPKNAKTTTDL